MTTDERARRESTKTTVLGEIKATKKEKLPQHIGRKLILWQGKEKRKKEEGIKKKKLVGDRQSIAER